jgi:hypothetical protein
VAAPATAWLSTSARCSRREASGAGLHLGAKWPTTGLVPAVTNPRNHHRSFEHAVIRRDSMTVRKTPGRGCGRRLRPHSRCAPPGHPGGGLGHVPVVQQTHEERRHRPVSRQQGYRDLARPGTGETAPRAERATFLPSVRRDPRGGGTLDRKAQGRRPDPRNVQPRRAQTDGRPVGTAQRTTQRQRALTTTDEVVKAAEAFLDARGYDRRNAELDLRRTVKRLRAERAHEKNAREHKAHISVVRPSCGHADPSEAPGLIQRASGEMEAPGRGPRPVAARQRDGGAAPLDPAHHHL